MAVKPSKAEKKLAYDAKLCQLLDEYSQVLVASADNVGSNQLQAIRKGLRGDSIVLMGKNTMMKRSIRLHAEKTGNENLRKLEQLLVVCYFYFFLFWLILRFRDFFDFFFVFVKGNVGLIFTKGDLKEVREEISKYKVCS